MRLGIGIVCAGVFAQSFMYACSGAEQQTGAAESDMATSVAALSVNGDGSDATDVESVNPEPLMARGCGFQNILEHVVARFDADENGALSAGERAALVDEFGDHEADIAAKHPNQGQPGKAADLLRTYDSDGSGSLESSEIAALQADIQARCGERLSELQEEFDTDDDGTLDDAEWEAVRAALRERIAEHRRARFAEHDTNGDGTLDSEERAALRQDIIERRESVESEFDGDGDGELSSEEREALREHLRTCVRESLPMDSAPVAVEPEEGAIGTGRRGRPEVGDSPEPVGDTDTDADTDTTPTETSAPESEGD